MATAKPSLQIELTNIPKACIVASDASKMLHKILSHHGYTGVFRLIPTRQNQMRTEKRFKVVRFDRTDIVVDIKPGNNDSCWQYRLLPPQEIAALAVGRELSLWDGWSGHSVPTAVRANFDANQEPDEPHQQAAKNVNAFMQEEFPAMTDSNGQKFSARDAVQLTKAASDIDKISKEHPTIAAPLAPRLINEVGIPDFAGMVQSMQAAEGAAKVYKDRAVKMAKLAQRRIDLAQQAKEIMEQADLIGEQITLLELENEADVNGKAACDLLGAMARMLKIQS